MTKFHDDWVVLPHGPLREVEDGFLSVVGQIPMPLGKFPRRMSVVALTEGRVAIYSPVPLAQAEMARIEALGRPAFLIIPNAGHRLDARPYRARYPDAKIITAPGARKKVEEAVPVDMTAADLGERATLIVVAGTGERELAMRVHHDGGETLLTNDIIGNVAHPQGPGAWVMARLMGFGPTPRIPRVVRRMFIKDPAALAAQLREWAARPGLRRLIPSHGDPIDHPAAVLHQLAHSLDGDR